jgi:hypothetical protein
MECRIGRVGCRITKSQDETAGQSYLIYKVEMGEVDRSVTQRVSIAQPYGGWLSASENTRGRGDVMGAKDSQAQSAVHDARRTARLEMAGE